jgi:hypothetical protein
MYDADNAATPTRYGVYMAIMREYGWSWRDLCEAPADLVEEIVWRTTAEQHWQAERNKKDAAFAQAKSMLG